jgi:hypothetical protein
MPDDSAMPGQPALNGAQSNQNGAGKGR